MHISTKLSRGRTVLDRLGQSGSSKCLFTKNNPSAMDAILLNTAGGVTGGDRFAVSIHAASETTLTTTTQAFERAYRAQPGEIGKINNHLHISAGARINWLPQETILFEGSALERQLRINMEIGASLLMVESVVFGRAAMGETLADVYFKDRIDIRRDDRPLYIDTFKLAGDVHAHLRNPFIADGAGAMATVIYVADDAETHLSAVRALLPEMAGASLFQDDVLVMRLLAEDSFALRQTLIPVLHRLNGDLPRCWMI